LRKDFFPHGEEDAVFHPSLCALVDTFQNPQHQEDPLANCSVGVINRPPWV
jgi:hypothetical protein